MNQPSGHIDTLAARPQDSHDKKIAENKSINELNRTRSKNGSTQASTLMFTPKTYP